MVPETYEALRRKGVADTILQRDEHGFFERVVTVHPLAPHRQVIELNATHRVVEFTLGRSLGVGRRAWQRALLPFDVVSTVASLISVIRRERADVIRATDPYLMGLLAWLAARLTATPFCVSIHADYEKNFALTPKRGWAAWRRRLAAWIPSFVLPRADMVLPIRSHLIPWVRAHGAKEQRIRIVPHGLDMTPFTRALADPDLGRRYDIPRHAPIVSFAGRLSHYNYVHDVLDVAERLLPLRPDAVFVLMGDGEERGAIEQRLARSPTLATGVRLVGFRDADDVVALRRASPVSLCLMGGFSLIEACAAGSAVIAYDVDWHRDLITTGETGVLVPEGDVAGVAAAVLSLLDDPGLARRLGSAARARAFTDYDERRTSEIKRDCYRAMLQVRPA